MRVQGEESDFLCRNIFNRIVGANPESYGVRESTIPCFQIDSDFYTVRCPHKTSRPPFHEKCFFFFTLSTSFPSVFSFNTARLHKISVRFLLLDSNALASSKESGGYMSVTQA